jgi:hypothetical protein
MYDGRGDTAIVYEGGAVFRDSRAGGVVVEDPPFRFENGGVIVPIIQIKQLGNATAVSGGTVRVRGERSVREPLPEFVQRAADYDALIVNVTSPRSDLWERYLETDADATCTETRADTVECRIDDPRRLSVTRTVINFEFET